MIGLRARIDAGAEQLVAPRDVARHREQQAEADVGGGVGDDRRDVGDRDAARGRLGKIDAVLRDVHRRHRLELRIGGQHVAVDGVVQQRQQDVAALHRLDQLVLRQHAAGIRIDLDVGDLAQPRQRAFGDRLGDENARPAHGFFDAFLIAALTFGSTFSASKVIERLAKFGIAPVLAGIEQRAEVADLLAEFQNLVGDLARASRG